jgi:hypothetical protein
VQLYAIEQGQAFLFKLAIQLPQHCVTTLCAKSVQMPVKRKWFLFSFYSLRTIADRLEEWLSARLDLERDCDVGPL